MKSLTEYLNTENMSELLQKGSLISYDIDRMHTEVKNKMIDFGYQATYNHGAEILPNTTLIHAVKTPEEAINDLKNAIIEVRKEYNKKIKLKNVVGVCGTLGGQTTEDLRIVGGSRWI